MYPLATIVFENGEVYSFRVKNEPIANFFLGLKEKCFSKDWGKFPVDIAQAVIAKNVSLDGNMAYTAFLPLYAIAGEEKREDVFNFLQQISKLSATSHPTYFIF